MVASRMLRGARVRCHLREGVARARVREGSSLNIGFWDIALVLAVTLQVAAVAYLYQPRWKAFVLTLPIPFSLSVLALHQPVDATNVLGTLVLLLFANGVRWLHYGAGLRIVPSIALMAIGCGAVAVLVQPHVPANDGLWFDVSIGIVVIVALLVGLTSSHVEERGHRTPLPIYVKLPCIAMMVMLLVILKRQLGGFMTVFPMVTVFAAYESRHSLATLCRQMPVLILTLLPLMIVVRIAQAPLGYPAALCLGWLVFLAILFPINNLLMRRGRVSANDDDTNVILGPGGTTTAVS
jgi:hypothetical protein